METTASTAGDCVYRIDASDRISFVDARFHVFAHDNDWLDSRAQLLLGSCLWDHISDRRTQQIYRDLVAKVRRTDLPVTVPLRCDTPELRRFLELRIRHLGGGTVEFASSVLRLEPRPPVRLLVAVVPRSEKLIVMCSWCKRMATPEWLEVEAAIAKLNLFDAAVFPAITHGICEECARKLDESFVTPS